MGRKGLTGGVEMTDYEKEVIITLNAGQDMASVYSADPEWTKKMDRLCMEIPYLFRFKRWTEAGKLYVVPKEYVRIGKPEGSSPVQMEKAEKVRHGIRIRAAGGRLLWWVPLLSLVGSVIIFSITLPARFPGVRGWKTPVLKK